MGDSALAVVAVPLQCWMEDETLRLATSVQQHQQKQEQQHHQKDARQNTKNCGTSDGDSLQLLKHQSLLRQITVAFCVAELLRHASRLSSSSRRRRRHHTHLTEEHDDDITIARGCSPEEWTSLSFTHQHQCCCISGNKIVDNFIVHVANHAVSAQSREDGSSSTTTTAHQQQQRRRRQGGGGRGGGEQQCWNNVKGVTMLHPLLGKLSALLIEPFFLIEEDDNCHDDDDDDDDDDLNNAAAAQHDTTASTLATRRRSLGRYVEVEVNPPLPSDCIVTTHTCIDNSAGAGAEDGDEDKRKGAIESSTLSSSTLEERNECQVFGILMYEILCAGSTSTSSVPCPWKLLLKAAATAEEEEEEEVEEETRSTATAASSQHERKDTIEPYSKKRCMGGASMAVLHYDKERKGKSYYSTSLMNAQQNPCYSALRALGFPSSISTFVRCLMDGNDTTYMSLDEVCSDIQLLLSDPECFLFDNMDRYIVGYHGAESSTCIIHQPQIKIGKLYGREDEVSLVTDAFCRVSSGQNEALFIGGYSGSGKSMLVQSLKARINIAGGYVLTQKCDEISNERPLLDVLRAFDDLCLLIRKKSTPQTLLEISNKLVNVFESDFSVLARLLPNINVVFPKLAKPMEDIMDGAKKLQGMNLNNVCFVLQRFMRIVSSTETPVMLFLDDLQWAGSTSLELIHALLSDKRGPTCFLFVGSYRNNEVQENHPLFYLMSNVESSGVRLTKLQLSGLDRNSLNMMVSESLGILPHLCSPLGNIIFEKTDGNPYFALEFLRSLVDKRLLKFCGNERRWTWDEGKIRSENITDNVRHLLVAKMTSLPDDIQSTLMIVSCFGIKVDQAIVDNLCWDQQFFMLSDRLIKAVDKSWIQKIDNGFQFMHDKIREAAYSLIPDGVKRQFHYDLGMKLYFISKEHGLNDTIFPIVDQINHGVPSLVRPEVAVEILELNLKAGARAMEFLDYETASSYLSKAILLLPQCHWQDHYELSPSLYISSAKAAYSCGDTQQTRTLLNAILLNGRCIEDKLDAYYLHVTILNNSDELDSAYFTCRQVLIDLNETIPDTISCQESTTMVKDTGKMLEKFSLDSIAGMKEMDSVLRRTLRFLSLLLSIVYFKNPDTMLYIGCKMIHLTLTHGICKESIYGFIQYAAILCQRCRDVSDIKEACRIGEVAMSLMKRFSSPEVVPKIFSCYFGFVAVHTKPLHECADNLRRGFEVGISGAGAVNLAFFSSIFLVRNAMFSGENLLSLRNEIDYHLDVMTRFKHKLFKDPLLAYRETISHLIDKTHSSHSGEDKNVENFVFNSMNHQRNDAFSYFITVLQSFWLGYSDRCDHYAKKALNMRILGSHNWLVTLFYAALNAFRINSNGSRSRAQLTNLRQLYKNAIVEMKSFATLSPLNYEGKVCLLEAEMYSLKKKNEDAQSKYSAAVSAFRNARYVQEQGLACELAGFHYTRIDQLETALDYFHQARECYVQWGSNVKVEFITHQISHLVTRHLEE